MKFNKFILAKKYIEILLYRLAIFITLINLVFLMKDIFYINTDPFHILRDSSGNITQLKLNNEKEGTKTYLFYKNGIVREQSIDCYISYQYSESGKLISYSKFNTEYSNHLIVITPIADTSVRLIYTKNKYYNIFISQKLLKVFKLPQVNPTDLALSLSSNKLLLHQFKEGRDTILFSLNMQI